MKEKLYATMEMDPRIQEMKGKKTLSIDDVYLLKRYQQRKQSQRIEKFITNKAFKKNHGIKISDGLSGKMCGILGLSTSCLDNKYCKERSKDINSVCHYCYAKRGLAYRKNVKECYEKNGQELKKAIIPVEDMPNLNCFYFRLESHGDLENEIQLVNYINLCIKNPKTRFALWTKNTFIVDNYMKKGGFKPSNLNIVVSSSYLNTELDVNKYDWADVVFTVYDKKTAKEKDIDINCGAKSCFQCAQCYKKHKNVIKVNELLK